MNSIEPSSPPFLLVFDLDGVVIDSRAAVVAAYRAAGIEMPPDAWGKPWRSWCPPDVHVRKVRQYPRALREHGRPGPLINVVRALGPHAHILTGASVGAVETIRNIYELWDFTVLGVECTTEQKLDKLRTLGERTQLVYFDDDLIVVNTVNHLIPGSTAIHVRGE